MPRACIGAFQRADTLRIVASVYSGVVLEEGSSPAAFMRSTMEGSASVRMKPAFRTRITARADAARTEVWLAGVAS